MTRSPPASDADGERIHKALARSGAGSRRAVERLVAEGRILVNGAAADIGMRVHPGDRIQIDGGRAFRLRAAENDIRVLAYNKPVGEVCTRRDEQRRRTVFSRLPRLASGRWINVGRLDINTSGLLLFTNHGELAHRLMHPRYRVDREYAARIFGRVDNAMLERLRQGVEVDGERLAFADIVAGDSEDDSANRWYYCVVQSGRQREVRRLWESQGVQVSRLSRVRFANVMLPTDLRPGRSVELGGKLLDELCALVGIRNHGPAKPRSRRS